MSNSPRDLLIDYNSPNHPHRNYDSTRSKNKLLASVDSDGHILSKSPSNKGSHNSDHHNHLQMLNHHRRKSFLKEHRSKDKESGIATSLPMLNLKSNTIIKG